ncbi:MAG TPA: lysophospholipid acyltransferase family protein [Candidatus Obscuribacterales bacterium]
MTKRFRAKDLLYKYPWLGQLQMRLMVNVLYYGVCFFERSFRKMRVMSPGARKLISERKPVIYALYHGDMDLMLELPNPQLTTVLISPSRDGDMIAAIAGALGYRNARGSSARRGAAGLLECVEEIKNGYNVAMLVDGPKGPWHEIKPGVIKLAQMTGAPIIPLGMSSRSCWWATTWDRFNMVSLFGPVLSVYSDPLYVACDATEEELDRRLGELDARMNSLNTWSDEVWRFSDGKRNIGFVG